MINHFQFLKQFDEQMNSTGLTHIQQKDLLNKYVELLLADLQIGDSIEGVVAKLSEGKYGLQIKPNITIPVHMFEQLEAGKFMTFVVQGKEAGKLYLQPEVLPESKETPLSQKTLEELNLPKTPSMTLVIDDFLQKHLPLVRENLLKAYQFNKEFDIPSKVLANLLDNQQVFSTEEAKAISDLRTSGIHNLIDDVKRLLDAPMPKGDLIKLLDVLKPHIFYQHIETISKSTVKTADAEEKKVLLEFLKANHAPIINQPSIEFTKLSEGTLRKLIHLICDDALQVNIKQIKSNQRESEKVYKTHELLSELLDTLEKSTIAKEDKERIAYIKEPLNLLGKLNIQADYFVFPMLHENKPARGEVYFFKPKKTTKKNKGNMYVVVALMMAHINEIQIHINKQENTIALHLDVENEAIQKHISQHLPKLNNYIEALGFGVSKITWGLLDEERPKFLADKEHLEAEFNHMDFKV